MDALDELHSGHFRRGLLLKEQGRYPEAEPFFRDALGQNPRDAASFHHLAGCLFQIAGREAEALPVVDEAIALEPEEAGHHALQAHILCFLERPKEGLAAAQAAVELEPDNAFCFVAESQALLCLERWAEAERAARCALGLDPENLAAANQLSRALRLQNKMEENREQLVSMLARDPENAYTHANAGWSALQSGNRREAEAHFLESLRLDPESEWAREGLLQSFRARSPFYRAYLSYSFMMQRLSGKARWGIILGLYFGVRFARVLFSGPYAPIGLGIGLLYVLFVLWVWVARGVGNFILLLDRFARHALRREERWEAVAVAGSLLLGTALAGTAFLTGPQHLIMSAIALCAASIPLSLVFTNRSVPGRVLFGAVALFGLCTGLLAGVLGPAGSIPGLVVIAVIAAGCCTWLGNVSFFKKR